MTKKYKLSLFFNIIIFVLVLIGIIFMITGFRFMGEDKLLVAKNIEAFKFFTVDSNALMGIAALIYITCQVLIEKNRIKEIPKIVYILKFVATVSISLTFTIVLFYLAPFSNYGFFDFYTNSNLFFHLFVPILSIITFVCFENKYEINNKTILWGFVPIFIYSIYYMIGAYSHVVDGKVTEGYDWYGFFKSGASFMSALLVSVIMIVTTYLIIFTLRTVNSKMNK